MDEQRRTRPADAAHAADGDAWNTHAMLPIRTSLAANIATYEEFSDPGSTGKVAQGSDGSSGSTAKNGRSV